MPLSESARQVACSLVFNDYRIRLAIGLRHDKESVGRLADFVWDYCQNPDNNMLRRLATDRDYVISELTTMVRNDKDSKNLVGFIPLIWIYIIKIIISILVDYWLTTQTLEAVGEKEKRG